MKIQISKQGASFVVDPIDKPGSPRTGRGRTMDAAIADFFRVYQKELGITEIILDEKVKQTELRRRQRELAKR